MCIGKVFKLLLVLAVCLVITGGTVSKAAALDAMVLKLGTGAVTGHPVNLASDEFAKLVKEKSGGKITVECYYNGVLGSDREITEQIASNMLDLGVSAVANAISFAPEVGVLDLPYLFVDDAHVQKVLASDIMVDFAKLLEERSGIKVLAWFEAGWREVYNTVRPISKPEDFKGIKIRIQESSVFISMFEAVNAIPTPMAISECYTALQQKTIDATDNGIFPIFLSKYSDFGGYLSLTHHAYGFSSFMMPVEKFDSLSPEVQKILVESAKEAQAKAFIFAKEISAEALVEMQKTKMQVIPESDIDQKAIAEAMAVIYPQYEKEYGEFGKNIVERIRKLQ